MTPEEVARAEARGARIDEAIGDIVMHVREAADAVQHARSRRAVYWKLKLVSDTLTQHVAKEAPCKKGCSACCHIAVPISKTMADRIAAASGRTVRKHVGTPAAQFLERGRQDHYLREYYGKPCPFLGHDKACTIYDDRPLTCRNHYSLADDARPCDLDRPYGKIIGYDLEWIEQLEAACDLDDLWGDIREFFTHGT